MNKHKEAEEEPLLLLPSNPKRINVGNRNPLQPFFPPILILPLLLNFHQPCSAATNTIPLGSILTASNPNQTWSSPSSTFTLHFLPLSNSYSLAITYANTIPIWIAGGSASVVDSGASFHLLSTGDLRLLNGSGSLIWRSNTSNLGITHATLDDSGNLSLLNNSNPIWSSFNHPTDTIVQTQNFTTDMRLNSGRYSFTLNRNGNMTLMWNNSIIYWTLGLNSSSSATANLSNPSIALNNGTGEIFLSDTNLSSSVVMVTATDYATTVDLRFIKLDNDGNLRIYTAHQDSATTNPQWSAVSDQCEVFGYCGNMGVCSYNETDPICVCPSQNFEPIDSSDTRKGCRLKKSIKDYCPSNSTMLQMDHTLFLTYPPENTTDDIVHAGISPCEGNCLISSACVGATALSDGSGLCYIKTQGFVSAYQSAAIPSTSYVKVCPPVQPNSPPVQDGDSNGSKRVEIWFVGVAILVTVLILATTEYCIWWWFCRKSRRFSMLAAANSRYALLEYASGAPVQFSYRELHRATKGFSEKLGSGGFGAVYKGLLQNRTVVAVKQLEGIEQGEKQFRMEVATISSTHHLNLVRLIGFCSEGKHRLLVYEYMRNGSLDNLLFVKEGDDQEQSKLLDWENRFSILLGTAKGITYLHEECRDCIVHCDIKPENILLDESYTAKVSDFGLAKLISVKDQRYKTLTSVRGTRGYLAPEWLTNLPITSKSDVYSYGMVLLEMVSGKRNFEVSNQTNRKKFSNWAIEEFEKGNLSSIVDERIVRSGEVDMGQVERAVMVSFWCIQEQPSMRPTMGKVVQMLEGVVEIDRPLEVKVGNTDESEREGLMVVASGQDTTLVDTSAPNYPSSSSSFQYPRDPSSFSAIEVERRYTSLI